MAKESSREIRELIGRLARRAERLDSGEELCDHHWNGSDRCFETYCTGCQKHTGERYDENSIPFKSENFCYECSKTDEEKEQEKTESENRIRAGELKKLAELKAKYEP